MTRTCPITQKLSEDLSAAVKKARSTDQQVDVSSDVTGYKQAVEKLSASISACVGSDLLSEEKHIVVDARELERKMVEEAWAEELATVRAMGGCGERCLAQSAFERRALHL